MFDELKRYLAHLESAFSRKATYGWFVIAFVGFARNWMLCPFASCRRARWVKRSRTR